MYQKKHKQTAQIMVITAFVIAITFLLLATLLNIVIYAENQAARGVSVADQSAFETHTQVNNSVQKLVQNDNYNNYSRSYSQRENSISQGLNHIFTVHKVQETKKQNMYNGSIKDITYGTRLVQDTNRNFTSEDGKQDWILVSSTDSTRNMTQTVQRNSLHEAPNTTVWSIPGYTTGNSMFETRFNTPSGSWRVYIVEDDSTDSIYIRTEDTSGTFYDDCSITTSQTTVDYSNQTIGGNDCPALDFVTTELDDMYEIEYINGQSAKGEYHIHTSAELGGGVPTTRFNSSSSRDSPYAVQSIYSVEYTQYYISSTVEYDTTVYIAPHQLENE